MLGVKVHARRPCLGPTNFGVGREPAPRADIQRNHEAASIIGTQEKNTFKQNKKQLHISATSCLDLNPSQGEIRDKLPTSQTVSYSMPDAGFLAGKLGTGNDYCSEV